MLSQWYYNNPIVSVCDKYTVRNPMVTKCFSNSHNNNKNAFQSKANLPLADRKSNTYNLTLDDLDLDITLTIFMTLTSDKSSQVKLMSR